MFEHDFETNRLSLKPGKKAPWLRDGTMARTDIHKTWLYCIECSNRYMETGRKAKGYIPYRDGWVEKVE